MSKFIILFLLAFALGVEVGFILDGGFKGGMNK